MKRTVGFVMCYIILLMQANLWAQAGHKVCIYHTGDTHSCIEPIGIHASDTSFVNKAGVVRRATYLNQERKALKEGEVMLVLDSGDFTQGTPYYNIFKGDVEIDMMNVMKYDACTVGNHEFDSGTDNMARIFHRAEFPIISSNYDFSETVLADVIKPYVVLQRGTLRIGLFGLGIQLEGLQQAANYEGVKYLEPIETANRMIHRLKSEESCDVIICLSHLGEDDDEILIANTAGIDVVLGGHSHSYFENPVYHLDKDGNRVLLSHTGKNARYVGKIELLIK